MKNTASRAIMKLELLQTVQACRIRTLLCVNLTEVEECNLNLESNDEDVGQSLYILVVILCILKVLQLI